MWRRGSFFNPFDYKEIKGRLLRMMLDEDTRVEYSKRGLQRYGVIEKRQREDLQKLIDFIVK